MGEVLVRDGAVGVNFTMSTRTGERAINAVDGADVVASCGEFELRAGATKARLIRSQRPD